MSTVVVVCIQVEKFEAGDGAFYLWTKQWSRERFDVDFPGQREFEGVGVGCSAHFTERRRRKCVKRALKG